MSTFNESNTNCKKSELETTELSNITTTTTATKIITNDDQDNQILNLNEINNKQKIQQFKEDEYQQQNQNCDKTNIESINNNNNSNNILNDKNSLKINDLTITPTSTLNTVPIIKNNGILQSEKSQIKSILTVNGNSNADLNLSSSTLINSDNNKINKNKNNNNCSNNTNNVRKLIKKSVTFDPESEIVKKFIEGEVIVDKQNPFKNGFIQNHNNNNSNNNNNNNRKSISFDLSSITNNKKLSTTSKLLRPTNLLSSNNKRQQQKFLSLSSSSKILNNDDINEFVTKEDVLKESKYVKTYIKNPDKYFTYDPTIIAKIKFEELRELKNKKPPSRKIRLSSQTQERLKDIKKQQQQQQQQQQNKTKIPSYKKVTKSNYPDLSDIKVKVGTDIEESFFNPEEVTINAKKFDECVKKLQISSDDDLDEIDTILTKSDSSDELKTIDETTTTINESNSDLINNVDTEKKSFTNTVNSKEFQEFLNKKGLLLTPKKTMLNGDIKNEKKQQQQQKQQQKKTINNNNSDNNKSINKNQSKITMSNNTINNVTNNNVAITNAAVMEPKKMKKPSMFQRLLPSNIFSSKRKTTPKETVPISQNVYTATTMPQSIATVAIASATSDLMTKSNFNNENKLLKSTTTTIPSTSSSSSPIKRIVLERQSFHGGSVINSDSNSTNDLRKCIERSRKSYGGGSIGGGGGDDRSSSISSALTNAEEFTTNIPANAINSNNTITNSSNNSANTVIIAAPNVVDRQSNDSKITLVEIIEPKKSNKEQLNTTSKSLKATKIKKTSSRERLQNFHSKSVIDNNRDVLIKPRIQKQQTNSGNINKSLTNKMSQKIEKSESRRSAEKQCPPKRSTSFEEYNSNSKRSSSLGRHESSKRQNSLPKVSSSQHKVSLKHESVADDSMENGPKMTSTPLRSSEKAKQTETKISVISPPKEYSAPPPGTTTTTTFKAFDIGPEEWARLQEIKELTDRELFNRITPVQVIEKTHISENIYEKLPPGGSFEQQPCSLPYRAEQVQMNSEINFVRGSPQRNTFSGIPSNRHIKVIEGTNFVTTQVVPKISSNDHIKPKIEPPRSQSVMDEMITGHQQSIYGSIAGTPVIMRRKGSRVLSREEILNKVKEFCRKSMNRTPTNGVNSQSIKEENKVSSNISPVSYASVDYQNRVVGKAVAPQVPQRIQSLQNPATSHYQLSLQSSSPVYAHVMKRSSIQSNVSDIYDSPQRRTIGAEQQLSDLRPRASTISDTDSVFLPVNRPSSSSPSGRYVIVDNSTNPASLTPPIHTVKYQNEIIYRQTTLPSPYGYIQLKPQQMHQTRTANNCNVGSNVVSLNNNGVTNISNPTYRASPNIIQHSPRYNHSQQGFEHQHQQQQSQFNQQLQQTPQQQQQQQQRPVSSVVYLKLKDQVYTPITNSFSGKNFIPTTQQQQPLSLPAAGTSSARRPSFLFPPYESESGSEAGEVQRILQNRQVEEDWQNDKSGRSQSNDQASDDRRRAARREDPRRHTLGGDMLQYGGGQGQMQQQRAMDLEMGTRAQKSKKAPPIRGYTPINQGPLFDEDPGIMSEVETASTGFRRGGKQRSSLPVVRTPSKTLERPLGLVFLQYRSETKRALLPNEITSIDTVRALFVRSFPRQLTMAYLEGPNVKIYIHDASKDMFYELEDVRSHLREIRDRSVLRLFESNEVAAPQVLPGGPGVPQPLPSAGSGHWDQEQSYFSEPEFDSEYQHQHIHKSKGSKPAPYYVGATHQTLPRGMYSDRNKNTVGAPVKPLRSYGSRGNMGSTFPYTPDQLYSIPDGYTSSPERGTRGGYEEPYYSQYGTRGGTVTPIIDEEQRCDGTLTEDQYALYGMKVTGRIPRAANQLYDPTRPEDLHRIRVEHMERQLANLTGLVQKALNQNPQMTTQVGAINANYLTIPGGQCRGGLEDLDGHSSGSSTSIQANGTGDDIYIREKPPKLGKTSCHKSVSFEKSVSFSDDIQGVPKSHSPQHTADTKPPKPAIKSSTLPRTSSQERDRLKPPPPPKPLTLATGHPNYRPDIALAPEVYNHLRGLQKKAKDLRMEVRTLRRLSQAQAIAVREDIKDAFMRIRATLLASSGTYWGQGDQEKTRLSREEELYKQEVIRLEKDLTDLETSVEGLRGEVINRRTRVNMAAVEDMALVLSRASKTVAELKMRFPGLQQGLHNILANEMEKVVREEKFLKDEPDRLESALRRCKKLTGTLVTLKRLASVQEQRLPVIEPSVNEDPPRSAEISSGNKPIPSPRLGSVTVSGGVPPENALDALLDELQTFAKPQTQQSLDSRPDDSTSDDSSQTLQNTITTQLSQVNMFPINDPNLLQNNLNNTSNGFNQQQSSSNMNNSLRRLHSYPSGSDTDTSPPQPSLRPVISVGKPPVPERNADLLSKVSNKRIPPPPPPRTSSRSPLASPTSPNVPQKLPSVCETSSTSIDYCGNGQDGSGNSSGNESGNDHVQRQLALEMRHQELLKKQKVLQEQYARLQAMSKNSIALPPSDILQLKKTGSESNLPQKMGLSLTVTGSMKNLNAEINITEKNEKNLINNSTKITTGTTPAIEDQSTKMISSSSSTSSSSSSAAPTTISHLTTTTTTNTTTAASTGSTGIIGGTATTTTTTNKVYETDIL